MKRPLLWAIALLAIVVPVAIVVTEPTWYLRATMPLEHSTIIRSHAENYDLPPELVAAVIMQESGFDERAKSPAGAVGLMQVTPDTAKGIALNTGGHAFRERDLLNAEINIRYGCFYLRRMREKYAHKGNRTELALAAYNAGQGRVDQWIKDDRDGRLTAAEIPFEETREYVTRVSDLRDDYRRAYPELLKPPA